MSEYVKQDIESWIQPLTELELPIFSATVSAVSNAIKSKPTSAAVMAAVILQDASPTVYYYL